MRNYLLLSFIFFYDICRQGFGDNYLLKAIQENKDFSTFYELIKIANYTELFKEKTQFKKDSIYPKQSSFFKFTQKNKKTK